MMHCVGKYVQDWLDRNGCQCEGSACPEISFTVTTSSGSATTTLTDCCDDCPTLVVHTG